MSFNENGIIYQGPLKIYYELRTHKVSKVQVPTVFYKLVNFQKIYSGDIKTNK